MHKKSSFLISKTVLHLVAPPLGDFLQHKKQGTKDLNRIHVCICMYIYILLG